MNDGKDEEYPTSAPAGLPTRPRSATAHMKRQASRSVRMTGVGNGSLIIAFTAFRQVVCYTYTV